VKAFSLRRSLAAALLVLSPFVASAQSEAWNRSLDRFREQIRRDVAADDVGSIAAAVVVGDRMVWAEGFGWADRERKIPAGVETIYRIGSISKPIATIALVQLAQEGVLGLDDPVERYLPEASGFRARPDGAPSITFRQIATHTSGLGREPSSSGHSSGPVEKWEEKALAGIPTASFERPPGERVSYSNIGFATLGLALGRAAGRPFIEVVEESVFRRLELRSTFYKVPPSLEHLLAAGYANRAGGGAIDAAGPARDPVGRGYRVPNGGVYSTLGDMARLMGAMYGQYGDVLLTEEWRKEMMRLQTPGSKESGYGLGFSVRLGGDGSRQVGHGGTVSGYTAYMVFDPDAKIGVVLLRNYNSGRTNLSRAGNDALRELVAAAGSSG
jgi:CubicO group peptidase (beta-lactamase class C family)